MYERRGSIFSKPLIFKRTPLTNKSKLPQNFPILWIAFFRERNIKMKGKKKSRLKMVVSQKIDVLSKIGISFEYYYVSKEKK